MSKAPATNLARIPRREVEQFLASWEPYAPSQRQTFEALREFYPKRWSLPQALRDIVSGAPRLIQRRQKAKPGPMHAPWVMVEVCVIAERWRTYLASDPVRQREAEAVQTLDQQLAATADRHGKREPPTRVDIWLDKDIIEALRGTANEPSSKPPAAPLAEVTAEHEAVEPPALAPPAATTKGDEPSQVPPPEADEKPSEPEAELTVCLKSFGPYRDRPDKHEPHSVWETRRLTEARNKFPGRKISQKLLRQLGGRIGPGYS